MWWPMSKFQHSYKTGGKKKGTNILNLSKVRNAQKKLEQLPKKSSKGIYLNMKKAVKLNRDAYDFNTPEIS